MLIGTLPVVIAICANWAPALVPSASPGASWRRVAADHFIGLMLVNASELAHIVQGSRSLAITRWLQHRLARSRLDLVSDHECAAHEGKSANRFATWATVQGLATLRWRCSAMPATACSGTAAVPALRFRSPAPATSSA